ncbi:quinone-dependent dihydroorotate dehydrogenase [Oscillatoria sp. FACHB-1407]|uniref:quinone-dependent dihydroorotate dehydrogenase n=1 Tax=Oscillatoria sp. FACHB-1407 TaxID=2692847 RepID=UPI0016891EFD|nr:quinone-dependent dihydroorotate dehydrogenase [Oscillatoria sp. FACHB-1407]MBD2464348.1 quinone-dependent dihydroorotate dehydrogenase [Oscillatoria sp. FACHB-1407]
MDIYQAGIRPLLFSGLKADPEWLHQQAIQRLHWLNQHQSTRWGQWIGQQLEQLYSFHHPSLSQTLWGIQFSNPVGLAAGFDKDGLAAKIWSNFGFGFAELGTVTLQPQPGNPKPRLFRLTADQAVLNRMGFNNRGAAALATQLHFRATEPEAKANLGSSERNWRNSSLPLGINLGKSKVTPLEEAAADYQGSFRLLQNLGDYFVVNVSSPNTPGLRSLQSTEQLDLILQALQQANSEHKPILVKIAPDLEWEAIADVITLSQTYSLAGIIATNTTIRREGLVTQAIAATGNPITEEAGGISGAPLRQRSTDVIRYIYQKTQGTLPIIGVGGIFTAADAWEKMAAGASLVQVYTGWIYEGPWMVKRILQGLVERLEHHNMSHISEAIGCET